MFIYDTPSNTNGIHLGYWNDKDNTYPEYPDPFDYIDNDWDDDELNIVFTYLAQHGDPVGSCSERAYCRLCNKALGYSCISDGKYVWPQGFEHYILIHKVKPPQTLIDHCKENINDYDVDFQKLSDKLTELFGNSRPPSK